MPETSMKTYIEMIVGRATAEGNRYVRTMPKEDFDEYVKWKAEWLGLAAIANLKTTKRAQKGTMK